VNVVLSILPSLKLVTTTDLFKFCVPPGAVPTLTINPLDELFGLNTLTCNL